LLASLYKTKKEKKGAKSELERNITQRRKRRVENKMEECKMFSDNKPINTESYIQ
jgi:hypothetical protein